MILSVQYLRAVAALFVVYFHAGITPRYALGYENPAAVFGGVGVDIFFVISGFIMWQIGAAKLLPAKDFLKRRLTRIVPMYWIVTLCMFPMPAISGTIAAGNVIDFKQLIASLLFVPWPSHVIPNEFTPVYRPGWTLNYEMFFYGIFAIALTLRGKQKLLIFLICFFLTLVILGWLLNAGGILGVYTSPITLEFLYGVLCGWFLMSRRPLPLPAAVLAVILGLGLLALFPNEQALPYARFLSWGLPSALLLLGAISLEYRFGAWNFPIARLLGDASYSIYLTHLFSIGIVFVIWRKFGLVSVDENWSFEASSFVVLAFLLSSFIGVISYLFLEKPMLNYFHAQRNKTYGRQTTGANQESGFRRIK
jgi:exopolysaccharide production protein ExoZ